MTEDPRATRATRQPPRAGPPSRVSSPEWDGIRELRHEVRELRRANERLGRRPSSVGGRSLTSAGVRPSPARAARMRRRRLPLLGAGLLLVVAVVALSRSSAGHRSFAVPSRANLAGLSLGQRIVAIASSQVGYSTDPRNSYCNRFSAHWHAGAGGCPDGERSEKWCADFTAWVWQRAGVRVSYGFGPGRLNAGAVSFYVWGVAHGRWHPAAGGYVAVPGDVAVYGLSLGAKPSATHVAIVTTDPRGQRGPDVVNGDGDRTGFSVVETGTDQIRADAGRAASRLAGYVSPT